MKHRLRRADIVSEGLCFLLAGVMMLGFLGQVRAQIIPGQTAGQEAINAVMSERVSELGRRQDHVENMLQYGMIGLFGNLVAHAIQINSQRTRRKKRPSEEESDANE